MQGDKNATSEDNEEKQVPRRRRDDLTHKQAQGAVPEDLAVAGEEDGGVGIQHWRSDDAEEDDGSGTQ
jgi:hypothetical protein